ncbi:MAG: hypothetical protein ACI9E1_002169, partial [Cryomorphaceae bacterium]
MVTPTISIVPTTTIIIENLSSIGDRAISARKYSQTIIMAVSSTIASPYTATISMRTVAANVPVVAPSIP